MKPLKKHPKQQRLEDMTFPITKTGKKMNKIIAKALDKKDVADPELGSELTLDKLEAKFRKVAGDEDKTRFINLKREDFEAHYVFKPPAKKTKAMYQWDKALEESRQGLENQRCKSCGVYPGSSHEDQCQVLLEIRKRAWQEYKKSDKVTWTGREWLRSINDDNGFTLMPRIVWRLVAVGVLVGAVIYFLSKYGYIR